MTTKDNTQDVQGVVNATDPFCKRSFERGREYERERSAVRIDELANELLDERLAKAEASLSSSQARVEELERALEPFAAMAAAMPVGAADVWIVEGVWTAGVFKEATVGMFRRAAQALSGRGS